DLLEVFLTSVSLAVAAIPEGLVAVITIVLAIGMSKLAKEGAIIRKLPAVETLGSTQIICSDKTGTLTQNKMTVKKIYSDNQELLYSAMLHCNDTDIGDQDELIGDPTETALIDYLLANQEINKAEIENRIRAGEIPFDSERKKSSVIIERGDGFYRVFVKGAVDGMLDYFILSGEEKESLMVENEAMAAEALRVLAFGYKDIETYEGSVDLELEDQLAFLGLVGMIDPPREEVKEAIRVCREASIMPVMITGDHKITAVAIAEELGMLSDGRYAITGKELQEMSEVKFESEIDKIGVYARVAPEDKSRIVKMWQKKDKVVAMTGDGVNDAPALKTADIGVGMGITGTEVSKGASDMVLTDDNFATIVSAIREGRRIFDNIHKTISFLLSSNAGEVIAILLATILGWHLLSPIHILWINLVTDTFPALALGVEPAEGNLMAKKPRDSREPLFGKKQWVTVAFIGLIEGLLTLAAFLIGIKLFGDERVATTMAFVTLASTQLFASLGFQSSSESILRIKVKKHPALWLAFFGSLFIQLSVVLIPSLRELFKLAVLEPEAWFIIGFLSVLMLLSIEIKKLVTRIKNSKADSILK
ncbi:MAG: cation-translocating P-type ATPase, partial [Fusobacteria bacterium]|nr:cation-translocating P-type ATPase [Fusobacteriota bacterium]